MIYQGPESNRELKQIYKDAIKRQGYKMQDAAAAAGIFPQSLNNRFVAENISLQELARLCRVCGLSLVLDIIPAAPITPTAGPDA